MQRGYIYSAETRKMVIVDEKVDDTKYKEALEENQSEIRRKQATEAGARIY